MTEKVKQQHMFSNKMIAGILIPVVLEQLLNSIMGTADTMMVSNIGSAAISAVSLVDSINILVIQAFSALARHIPRGAWRVLRGLHPRDRGR